jgi:hypothetical protein
MVAWIEDEVRKMLDNQANLLLNDPDEAGLAQPGGNGLG